MHFISSLLLNIQQYYALTCFSLEWWSPKSNESRLVQSYGQWEYKGWKWLENYFSLSCTCIGKFPRNFNWNGCKNCQCYCKNNSTRINFSMVYTVWVSLTIEVPCEQRLHVCGMGWCAKSSLFGQPFIMHVPDLPHD